MNYRERFIESLAFGKPDRLLFRHNYGFMPGVLDRWHQEGLPAEIGEDKVCEYLGLDVIKEKPCHISVDFGIRPTFERKVIHENDEEMLFYDYQGVLMKIKKGYSTLSYPLEFPIRTSKDWEIYKPRLQYEASRIGENIKESYEAMVKAGVPVMINNAGFYWFPRELMGDQGLCLAYYTQTELVHDIIGTYADLMFRLSEKILEDIKIDVFGLYEDMCYKNNMMISPDIFKEFMMPHYKRMTSLYRKHGTRVLLVDTDGNISKLIPLLIEAGINAIGPAEVNAGNDIVAYRKEYGNSMAFLDGFNKLALADDPVCLVPGHLYEKMDTKRSIDLEVEYRLPTFLETGGYVVGLDHRTITETSLESYKYYIRRVSDRKLKINKYYTISK